MITQATTLVVGAGASCEYGLPLGGELKRRILQALAFNTDGYDITSDDALLLRALRFENIPNAASLVEAGRRLAFHAFPYDSIDEALHAFSADPEVVKIGKLAIASQILGSEQLSSLAKLTRNEFDPSAIGGWLPRFFSLAVNGLTRERIPDAFRSVTIVLFNYDRVIEHYIYMSVMALGMTHEEAAETVENLTIIRPYGSLGPLPWQGQNGTEYGAYSKNLDALTRNLRTFTEAMDDNVRARISQRLDQSAVVIYLGFGFHKQNVQIMQSQSNPFNGTKVFATAYNVDERNYATLKDAIKLSLRKYDHTNIEITPWTCSIALAKLWPSISFAVS